MTQRPIPPGTVHSPASPELIVFLGQPGWDAARKAWNLSVDQRPAAVALAESFDDRRSSTQLRRTVSQR